MFAMLHIVMSKKTLTIGIRVSEEFYGRLQKAAALTGVEPASLGRAGLEAIVNHIEQREEVTLPLNVITKAEYELFKFYKKQEEA